MKSVLFMIPTLDRGGAENVLVNLVNGMDQSKFKITVQTLFDKDSQKDRLAPRIEYRSFLFHQFHGNSKLMARIPPAILYRLIVGKRYDIVVSYLEGPTTHILSGCPYKDTKTVAWIHTGINDAKEMAAGFTSVKAALAAYKQFDRTVFVSEEGRRRFEEKTGTILKNATVLYNTLDSDRILQMSNEPVDDVFFDKDEVNLVSVGRIIGLKGYDRLARVQKKLREDGINSHTYIIGAGADEAAIRQYVKDNGIEQVFTFLGFKENPYKYVAKADLFVCSSRREGFSSAVTEALILGVPVVSTDCSGARELLGEHDEYGLVTENNEEALYQGVRRVLDDPALLAHYKKMAAECGKIFDTTSTVKAVEDMLLDL